MDGKTENVFISAVQSQTFNGHPLNKQSSRILPANMKLVTLEEY